MPGLPPLPVTVSLHRDDYRWPARVSGAIGSFEKGCRFGVMRKPSYKGDGGGSPVDMTASPLIRCPCCPGMLERVCETLYGCADCGYCLRYTPCYKYKDTWLFEFGPGSQPELGEDGRVLWSPTPDEIAERAALLRALREARPQIPRQDEEATEPDGHADDDWDLD